MRSIVLILVLVLGLGFCAEAQSASPSPPPATGTSTTTQSQFSVNSVQWWINQLLPLSPIDSTARQITPLFYGIGAFLIVIGCWQGIWESRSKMATIVRAAILIIAMGSSLWWLGVVQQIVSDLVSSISSVSGSSSLVATGQQIGSTQNTTVISFAPMASALAKYTQGSWANSPSMGWNIGGDLELLGNYIARLVVIGLIFLVSLTAVAVMTIMTALQQLIVILSQPFLPLFVGMLAMDTTRGNAHNFFKQLIGVVAWPVGWVLVFVGAATAMGQLPTPNWSGDIGQLIMVLLQTFVVCLWIVVGTIAVPKFITWLVVKGDNFAAGMVGQATSVGGQSISNLLAAAGGVTGASIGGAAGGSFGAQVGGAIGGGLGAASPVSAIQQGMEAGTGVAPAPPSAASRGAADAAISAIVRPKQQAEDYKRQEKLRARR